MLTVLTWILNIAMILVPVGIVVILLMLRELDSQQRELLTHMKEFENRLNKKFPGDVDDDDTI